MSKPDFTNVINELRTDLVAFVDDDFLPIENPGEIIYHFLCINDIDFDLVLTKLIRLDGALVTALTGLRSGFLAITFQTEDIDWFKAGEIVKRLRDGGHEALAVFAETFVSLIGPHKEAISALAMNTGLAEFSGAVIYQPFIDILNQYNPRKSVKIYRQLHGDAFNEFEEDLRFTLDRLPHKYFLFIVDKILGSNNGRDLITSLRDRANGIDTFFSILFTSRADAGNNPNIRVQEYLHFEIQKPAPNDGSSAVELVAGGLAICAYASFFDQIFKVKKEGLKTAKQLVVDSGQSNILYLAEMAHAEGTTVFRTVEQWFDLLVQKKIYDKLTTPAGNTLDYQFISGLTSLINETYLPVDGPILAEDFRKELQELSNFELFNNAVNKLYYPPAPGDIYQIGDKGIFILTGQDCDLIVREDGRSISRKEKLAELVQCHFVAKPLDDKKHDTEFGLALNYFHHEEQYGKLEIAFNKRSTIDFRVLDLCTLNPDGVAQYKSGSTLSSTATRSLPVMWGRYYPKLIEELDGKVKIMKFLVDESIGEEILAADLSYRLELQQTDGTTTFPVKRLSRLKGQFKDYFLQRYWEHKTRKGLNTISLYNRKPITGQVCCGFHDALNEISSDYNAWVQLTGNREKNRTIEKLPLVLPVSTLRPIIPEKFQNLFQRIKIDEIILNKPEIEHSTIMFKKRWLEGVPTVDICFPFYNEITKKFFKGKDELSLAELLTLQPGELPAGSQYHLSDQEDMFDLFKGAKYAKIPLEHFEHGIVIDAKDWHIKLDRDTGILDYVQPLENTINEQP
ncbi:MAG: hypothetical protein JST50_02680 [Bacteroidetes bacterium]|nr:hypothetical protein [Bacteroidota bacterium]